MTAAPVKDEMIETVGPSLLGRITRPRLAQINRARRDLPKAGLL